MIHLFKMAQLMRDDRINYIHGCFDEVGIQLDNSLCRTVPPGTLHSSQLQRDLPVPGPGRTLGGSLQPDAKNLHRLLLIPILQTGLNFFPLQY